METNREVFLETKEQLKKRKNNNISDTEIYRLLANANNLSSYTELVVNFDEKIKNKALYIRNLNKLLDGEPIQYILGKTSFIDLDVFINRNVLIPRPETEGLALFTKDYINKYQLNHGSIADICTGSGCIALYMKEQFKESIVYATDKYEDPLIVAKFNKERLNLDINLLKGSRLQPLEENKIKIDVLISNPPYVENINDIEPIVLRYEPLNAIYSMNGLHFYDSYFRHYKNVMNDKFFMAFEINFDQKEGLTALINHYFSKENVQYIFKKDIYGKDRYLFIFGGYDIENLEEKSN